MFKDLQFFLLSSRTPALLSLISQRAIGQAVLAADQDETLIRARSSFTAMVLRLSHSGF